MIENTPRDSFGGVLDHFHNFWPTSRLVGFIFLHRDDQTMMEVFWVVFLPRGFQLLHRHAGMTMRSFTRHPGRNKIFSLSPAFSFVLTLNTKRGTFVGSPGSVIYKLEGARPDWDTNNKKEKIII